VLSAELARAGLLYRHWITVEGFKCLSGYHVLWARARLTMVCIVLCQPSLAWPPARVIPPTYQVRLHSSDELTDVRFERSNRTYLSKAQVCWWLLGTLLRRPFSKLAPTQTSSISKSRDTCCERHILVGSKTQHDAECSGSGQLYTHDCSSHSIRHRTNFQAKSPEFQPSFIPGEQNRGQFHFHMPFCTQ
jgi:hypothetical protein